MYYNVDEKMVPLLKEAYEELKKVKVFSSRDCTRQENQIWYCQEINPIWYSNLLSMYPRKRTGRNSNWKRSWSRRRLKLNDSLISRKTVISILNTLIKKRSSRSKYAEDLVICIQESREDNNKLEKLYASQDFWEV